MSAKPKFFGWQEAQQPRSLPASVLTVDKKLRMETRVCLAMLIAIRGPRPGIIRLDLQALAASYGSEERNARRHLATLEREGYLQIIRREPRLFELFVGDPVCRGDRREAARKTAAAAQLQLPFAEVGGEEPGASSIPIWVHRPRTHARRPDHHSPPTAG